MQYTSERDDKVRTSEWRGRSGHVKILLLARLEDKAAVLQEDRTKPGHSGDVEADWAIGDQDCDVV